MNQHKLSSLISESSKHHDCFLVSVDAVYDLLAETFTPLLLPYRSEFGASYQLTFWETRLGNWQASVTGNKTEGYVHVSDHIMELLKQLPAKELALSFVIWGNDHSIEILFPTEGGG